MASLVQGRAKRSTAGNRMRALLDQEFLQKDLYEEIEDVDFESAKEDEEDVYESDFMSTDDEAECTTGNDAAEKQLEEEARSQRRADRQKARHTLHGEARSKKTVMYSAGHPETSLRSREPVHKKRKLSMMVEVDAETGTVIDHATRKSSRSTTVMNKQGLHERIKLDEEKKATIPKRPKAATKSKTQDELIREALELEEHNLSSLNALRTHEEERKAQAKTGKAQITGPKIRWVSRGEDVKRMIEVIPDRPPPPNAIHSSLPPGLANSPYAAYLPAHLKGGTKGRGTPPPFMPMTGYYPNVASGSGTASQTPGRGYHMPPAAVYPTKTPTRNAQYPMSYYPMPYIHSGAAAAAAANGKGSTTGQRPPPRPFPPAAASSSTTVTTTIPASVQPSPSTQTIQTDPVVKPSNQSGAPSGLATSTSTTASVTTGNPSSVTALRSAIVSTGSACSNSAPAPATSATSTATPTPSISTALAHTLTTTTPIPSTTLATSTTTGSLPVPETPTPATPQYRTVRETHNYVQLETSSKLGWREDWPHLFGSHVNWAQLRVFPAKGRNRPLGRQAVMCPVTGLPAKYREKETGIPFADARGWNIIRDLVKHRFVWSEEGGVYAGDDSEEKLEESGSVDDAVEEENSRPGRGRKGRGKQ